MNERVSMIAEYLSGEFSIAELARRRGISRKAVYKWIGRYQAEQEEGLKDLSRAPHHHPNAVSAEVERLILEWKAKRPLWGAPKIHSKLKALSDCPAESTVSNILRRHGLTRQQRRRSRSHGNAGELDGLLGCNEVWCADFKGWFQTGDGARCDPLTITDAYSRYLLCCQGIKGGQKGLLVKPVFERVFREYGLPAAILTDNGAPFASIGLTGLTRLSVWWIKLGIQLQRIEPGHPEQNGRHERMHRTLKEAVLSPPRQSLNAQQAAFDAFRQEYNQDRPHEALDQRPPACVYEPSQREYPKRLPQPEYPESWQKRQVRLRGEFKWKGDRISLSLALCGESIGLEPVADGLWNIYFMNQRLGRFNERKSRVEAPKEERPA